MAARRKGSLAQVVGVGGGILLGVLLVGLLAAGWIAVVDADLGRPDGSPGPLQPAMAVRGARLAVNQGGQRRWELRASEINVSRDRGLTTLSHITHGCLLRDGRAWLTFGAASASLREPPGHLTVLGGLTARSADGMTLRTARLDWYSDQDRFSCPQRVTVVGPRGTMALRSLVGDLKTRRLLGEKPVIRWRLPEALTREEEAELR